MPASANDTLVRDFSEITLADISDVGGKNASMGELFNHLQPLGVRTVDGFATTAVAYRRLLETGGLADRIDQLLRKISPGDVESLRINGERIRHEILQTELPDQVRQEVLASWRRLCDRLGREPALAVRSSATAEDLPTASFAGQLESYLNVVGPDNLLIAIQRCYASLFTNRAIDYRERNGFDHAAVALSVGVMPLVRSDAEGGSAGVAFTIDPDSGSRDVIVISGSWGLGEAVVQGSVNPDEWTLFKKTLADHEPIVSRQRGSKEFKIVSADGDEPTATVKCPEADRRRFVLSDQEVLELGRWCLNIEQHYSRQAEADRPMDIEWARDGETGELFILQARPETVHSNRPTEATRKTFRLLDEAPEPIVTGQAIGERISTGKVHLVSSPDEIEDVDADDVLVTRITDPDWEPVMKRVAAIVTDQGGRTAHAAIVSREIGLTCVVGAGNATELLKQGTEVTVSCAEGPTGRVYPGALKFESNEVPLPEPKDLNVKIMLNVADPERAFELARLPNDGVGLARTEFIIANHIAIHPMALAAFESLDDQNVIDQIRSRIEPESPADFFVRELSEGIGTIGAAFYPKTVIVRFSDFKTNEYARLLGGRDFEPEEENPMLGFRGASRYYDDRYRAAFKLECKAIRRVREGMGLTNVHVMIPFCRTVEEGRKVIEVMRQEGLTQADDFLIYAMCELPSNAVNADRFLEVFDGFSIGSNDLTQLTLGLDRDSGDMARLFDERDDSVKSLIAMAIAAAKRAGKPIGICGQAPSDYPDFADWLIEQGITSISLNPDALASIG